MTNENHLLAALSASSFERIRPLLDVMPLTLKVVLHKPGDPVDHVYFPGGGFCSVLTVLADGSMVEVLTIGREGMCGISAMVNGGAREPSTTMVQAASNICYRMPTGVFEAEMDRRGDFSAIVKRYAHALIGVVMQSTACNAVHSVEQRLARWLLMAHDRVERDEFPLTQEFAAMMLGATRQTVTVVAGTLQRADLIAYQRGRITIVDRQGLEKACCECYAIATTLLADVTKTPIR
jgi:CRP-like cAMP-binding protein